MSAKVVGLHGAKIYTGEPNSDVVAHLENWLEKARSGEITMVAVAAIYRDDTHGSSYAGTRSAMLVGELFHLMRLASDE